MRPVVRTTPNEDLGHHALFKASWTSEATTAAQRQHAGWHSVRWLAMFTVLVSVGALYLMVRFEVIERYQEWSQSHEEWELDKWASVFVVTACALLVWFKTLLRQSKREVEARAAVEAKLRMSHYTLQQVFALSPVPMFVSGRESSRVMAVNTAFERLLGYSSNSVVGHTEREIGFWKTSHFDADLRHRLVRLVRVDNVEVELQTSRAEARTALCSAVLVTLEGTPVIFGALNDITERKHLEGQLVHQAFHDALTDLPNRMLFEDRVAHALDRARRSHATPAVLFLDLDDFKKVNEILGYAAGDQLLREVARRLGTVLRTSDTCARFGGDEFAALLEDTTSLKDAMLVASRVREVLRTPVELDGGEMFIDVSIGISISDSVATAEDLLREADLALYASKGAGKGRTTAFELSMQDQVMRRLTLETDLRGAVQRNELRVLFQPIVNIASGELVGVEALARWQHPVLGLVSPAEFIPIAEESGLILEIGQWVLREACFAGVSLRASPGAPQTLTVNVNLSARQIAAPTLLQDVSNALAASGLPAVALTLEITESILMREHEMVSARLRELKELGVRLAIDDFGTGYSSLSYLDRFPVDVLKIDKSFTDRLGSPTDESEVARAVVALGGMVHLRTVVEGIETSAQRDRLLELGCEFGQGFLFSKPVELEVLRDSLRQIDPGHIVDDFSLDSEMFQGSARHLCWMRATCPQHADATCEHARDSRRDSC